MKSVRMMSTEKYRAPQRPATQSSTSDHFQSTSPINSSLKNCRNPIIKNLREVNLLYEIYLFQDDKTHVQESVEIIPQPVLCERIFYSYTNDHTHLRSREAIQLDQRVSMYSNDLPDSNADNDNFIKLAQNTNYDQGFRLDNYSTTLFIFPKQRNEKFITEIRYIPEHITIKYKSSLELLARTLTSSEENYYQNIDDFYRIATDIFYRI